MLSWHVGNVGGAMRIAQIAAIRQWQRSWAGCLQLLVFGCCLGLHLGGLAAAEIRVEPNGIRISGLLQPGDERVFRDALQRADKQTVRFDNCQGGQLGVAAMIAEMIRSRQLSTVATGYVQSACAIAFLHGVDRHVERSPLRPSVLMFHAAYDAGGSKSDEATDALINWMDALTAKRMPDIARDRMRASVSPQSGVYLWLPPGRAGVTDADPPYAMLYCAGGGVSDQCERLGAYTLRQLGIVDR